MREGAVISRWMCRTMIGRLAFFLLFPVVSITDSLMWMGVFFIDWIIGGEDRLRDKGWIP